MPKLDRNHVVYEATLDPEAKKRGYDVIRCYAMVTFGASRVIDRDGYPFEIPSAYKGAPLVPEHERRLLRARIIAEIYAEAFHHIETMAHAIRGEQRPNGDRFGAVLAAADALKWIDDLRAGFIGEPT